MSDSFDILKLRPELYEALEQVGYVSMTPVQAAALPALLQGRDLMGQAKTGSGKTAAFGLTLLQSIDLSRNEVQALVLCPTRELAEQVTGELRRLAQRLANTRIVTICGGKSNREQTLNLERGTHIVVGTPGRVGKHLRGGTLSLGTLSFLVLDEADRMLDMGFIEEVTFIAERCPLKRQTLLFSATFPEQIRDLSDTFQHEPEFVAVEAQVDPQKLRQFVFKCERDKRLELLASLLCQYRPVATLVFCEFRTDCDKVASFLRGCGASAFALHGGMEQRDRDDILQQFSNGSASVLVATNVAARGLDIPALPAVINYEVSSDPESHLHRIGRTGRAGEEGLALTIVSTGKERSRLKSIEAFMGQRLERGHNPTCGTDLKFLQPANRTLIINGGRKDKLRPGDIVGALVKDAKLPMEAIGKIDLKPQYCAVAISREYAQHAFDYLQEGRIKKKKFRVRLMG
jgi:ATP-dependent RNA helicase DbpA